MEWLEEGFTLGDRAQTSERAGLDVRLLQLMQWSTMPSLGVECIDGLPKQAKMISVVQGPAANSSG